MKKFIFTFGSDQLSEFDVQAMKVSLIVEGETEGEARVNVFSYPGIGSNFCTSYPYDEWIDKFTNDYGMREYTLDELEELRK